MTGIRVRVLRVAGSAPREPGAEMLVREAEIEGTIGGGALEWDAIREARAMLAEGRTAAERSYPLGPALGQCCGGSVWLGFAAVEALEPSPGAPVWVWGAGHVGRAIVATLAPLPDFSITWVDTAPDRFPEVPPGVEQVVAARPEALVPHAPRRAHHLVLTYSHDIDFALCHALLHHGFASAGLIGSATKRARFRSRLAALGHRDAQILRIACPIGDPALGKHPQAIAVGVAAALLEPAEARRAQRVRAAEGEATS